jgi:hypothetical protein
MVEVEMPSWMAEVSVENSFSFYKIAKFVFLCNRQIYYFVTSLYKFILCTVSVLFTRGNKQHKKSSSPPLPQCGSKIKIN